MAWGRAEESLAELNEVFRREDLYGNGQTVYRLISNPNWIVYEQDGKLTFLERELSRKTICPGNFYFNVMTDADRKLIRENPDGFINRIFNVE